MLICVGSAEISGRKTFTAWTKTKKYFLLDYFTANLLFVHFNCYGERCFK